MTAQNYRLENIHVIPRVIQRMYSNKEIITRVTRDICSYKNATLKEIPIDNARLYLHNRQLNMNKVS